MTTMAASLAITDDWSDLTSCNHWTHFFAELQRSRTVHCCTVQENGIDHGLVNGHWSWIYSHANQSHTEYDGSEVLLNGKPTTVMEWLAAQAKK